METPAFSVHTGRFPSVEQQVRQIEERVQALYAGEITIPADVVDEVLRAGGNRKGSIPRIIYNFMPGKTDGEYTEFIRKEYGTGGRGIIIGRSPDGKKSVRASLIFFILPVAPAVLRLLKP